MPRNYQLKRNNPYKMRHNLYMQTLYIIKDYEGLRAERINLLYQGTQPSDGIGACCMDFDCDACYLGKCEKNHGCTPYGIRQWLESEAEE